MNTKLSVAAQAGEPRDEDLPRATRWALASTGTLRPFHQPVLRHRDQRLRGERGENALWMAEEQMMEATPRRSSTSAAKINSSIREASMLTWRMRRAFSYGTAASRYATCLKSESVQSQSMAATTYSLNWRRKASWRLNLLPHVSFTLGSVRASFSMAKLDGVYKLGNASVSDMAAMPCCRRGLMPYATTGYQVKEGRP